MFNDLWFLDDAKLAIPLHRVAFKSEAAALMDMFGVPEELRHLDWVLRDTPDGQELVATSEELVTNNWSGWECKIL